ncbi:hypothetical protein QX233_03035 [Chryseobacterium gambrini]|uniref:Pycsar effector protein domain-containing protein n=1 Tax=Chryseobacterium gambrini TaxID=373672 RepID=A0AAJ1R140_9FLAO|nr:MULTISPECIES: hypothetical protein [Chryseobacterium]MDN4011429.1 hypothetical protein [Chryseobacterium gambrini]QWA38196.1 hypothetical protein KKI44_20250 [Chryseobacterium sp. ZHDP1]
MEKIEYSTKRIELISQWISNCDTKSSFILTFYGVVLTIIFTSSIGSEMISFLSCSIAAKLSWESFVNFILLLTTIGFFVTSVITFYQIYLTLKGRINVNIYKQNGLNTDSNIFFGTIATKTFDIFESEVNSEDEVKYLNDLNSQIFVAANIATEKFKHYNKSLFWMFVSLGVFLFHIVFK